MDKFAKEDYYQSIIDAAVVLGYRFLAKVQIDTNDAQYFIEAKCARNTTLTFDIPGRAVFINLNHNEHTRGDDDVYQNHWTIDTDFQYLGLTELNTRLNELDIDKGGDAYAYFRKMLLNAEIPNTTYHWRTCSQEQVSYGGDVGDVLCGAAVPFHVVVNALIGLKDIRINLTAEKFEELSFLWHPHYTFTGLSIPYDGKERFELGKKVKDLFWERFGDSRKIIAEKVKRAY